MAKPEELPADHVVRSIPGTLETGIDFVGDTYGARGWIRVYEEGALVWYSGPHPHGVFRLMGADLLDNADRADPQREVGRAVPALRGRPDVQALAPRGYVGVAAPMPRGRMRRPKRREPALPPWDRSECSKCAAPVRLVYLPATEPLGYGTSIEVGMLPAPLTDRRATVAATVMNNRLEGRHRIPGTAPQSYETLWIPHQDVCPEIPRPEQLALPTDQE